MNVSNYAWNKEELRLIAAMKKHPEYCSSTYKSRLEIERMWRKISKLTNIPESVCRSKWSRIRRKYINAVNKNVSAVRTKYLDGRLSFLRKYVADKIDVSLQSNNNEVLDEGLSNKTGLIALDLKTIDDVLSEREEQADIDKAHLDKILKLVSKRIDESLASYSHLIINEPANIEPETAIDIESDVEVFNDSNFKSESRSPKGDDLDEDSSSLDDEMRNYVRAFSPTTSKKKRYQNISFPVAETSSVKREENTETIFDIYQNSDTNTFCQELGRYMKKFSVTKQDELRLKICCLVTEFELDEIE